MRSECVQRRLLALDLLLGGGFGRDPQRDWGVEDQSGDVVGTRCCVGQRHLGAVANADEGEGRDVPEFA
ncbi:Uncharacterised protein [Mycobacterium tuberculosis]|nr:Uncharacterised protein [Mycobacterium tuberculosis]